MSTALFFNIMKNPLFYFRLNLLFFFIYALSSCGGASSSDISSPNPATPPDDEITQPNSEETRIDFTFDNGLNNNGTDGWLSGFSDYPVNPDTDYQLTSGLSQLPPPLESISGFNLSGTNRSDDLFMFIKKRFSGFAPNTQYQLQFEITFASNAPAGCIGAGGAPGEAVTIKAGASIVEPLAINNGNDVYQMNIDKGNQKNSGSNAINIGDFANSKNCEDNDFTYELKTLNNDSTPFSIFTNSDGALWILLSTDSGFESTTSIYYISGTIRIKRQEIDQSE
ncbi:hypothetical protein MNBD_GAMMA06-1286 [hydrothermal vent metagenome]|uniref:Uncharacterized protein n=1 Tax=hydrothermal vent metagenome TaxID=652676 RepID=A0A3B0WNQ2_9ZZZZ